MSMRKQGLGEIPEITKRVALSTFRKGNRYIETADELGQLFEFGDFEDMYPNRGQSAEHPIRLAIVLILQFAEGLSDRAAADAVRSRIDWKYILHLNLEDPGFDFSVLSEFRTRLVEHNGGEKLFSKLIDLFKSKGLVKERGKQRTDSTHVLAAIRVLNRLELVHETMRNALEFVAATSPDFLREIALPSWLKRYDRRLFSFNQPKTDAKRDELARTIASDGFHLLNEIDRRPSFRWLSESPPIETLRKVWEQQYTQPPEPPRFLKHEEQVPSAQRIISPHDTDARFSIKKGVEWGGYKLHLTETCDDNLPRLIVNVESTPATTPDCIALPAIHQSLGQNQILPSTHLADAGYVNANTLESSKRDYDVRLMGPPDSSWQAKDGFFDQTKFQVNWRRKYAICPQGNKSKFWTKKDNGSTKITFGAYDCYRCPLRDLCVHGTTSAGHPKARSLLIRSKAEYETKLEEKLEYKEALALYGERSGIEGTISQVIRNSDARVAKFIGKEKVRLEHIFAALATNLVRIGDWLLERPLGKTRKSHLSGVLAA